MQNIVKSFSTQTLATITPKRTPSAHITVSNEAMPVTPENLAQTLLNNLSEKFKDLKPREKEQAIKYLQIWQDVLATLP